MNEFKEAIKDLIDDNVSAIQIMSDKIGMSEEEVIALLHEMLEEGFIRGRLSGDGRRFFREGVKVSDRPVVPVVPVEDTPPPFMKYDTRPGKVVAFIGFLILVFGAILLPLAQGPDEQSLATSILLVGTAIILIGCYQVGRRKTP